MFSGDPAMPRDVPSTIADLPDLALIGGTATALARRMRGTRRSGAQHRQWHEFLVGHDLHDDVTGE